MKQLFTKLFLAFFALVMSASLAMAQTVIFQDDFESDTPLSAWTLVDNDGDGNNWDVGQYTHITQAYSGSYMASSWSWSENTYYPDNWMITPLVEGAASVRYFVSTSPLYPDHYGIMASTTGNALTDFNVVFEEIVPVEEKDATPWLQRDIPLPQGTKYVAFRHYESDDQNYLLIDDVKIFGEGGGSGIAETFPNINAKVHPNPVVSDLKIECEKNIDKLELYDAFGRIVISQENVQNNSSIDVSSLANGIYILKLRTAEGVGEYKVVKN